MGCAVSKVDDLPAVSLCRDRLVFLHESIRQRYALAQAHSAYMDSLPMIVAALDRLITQDFVNFPPSPDIDFHPQKDVSSAVDMDQEHLKFASDSDGDDTCSSCLHISGHSSPLHTMNDLDFGDYNPHGSIPSAGVNGSSHTHMNYSKSERAPSLLCEFRPDSPETGHAREGFVEVNYMQNFGTESVSYVERPENPETGRMGEPPTYHYGSYSNPGSSYFRYSNYPPRDSGNSKGHPSSSYSNSPHHMSPPPPPPPQYENSGWDFLNLFDIVENANHYKSYVSSRNSKEIREEEGIPDLEDEYHEREVVKEVQGNQKFVHASVHDSVDVDGEDANLIKKSQNSVKFQSRSSENVGMEYDVHVVDDQKKTIDHKLKNAKQGKADPLKVDGESRSLFEALIEIKVQFDNASRSGLELSKILEVGKLQYRKSATHQVSSKVLHAITPPRCSPCMNSGQPPPSSVKGDMGGFETDEDPQTGPSCLSSSLQKCYLWEKKLLNEVKAEESLRIVHEKKCQRLKNLRERGSDANKIDSTRNIISTFSTKIRFSIQVVDRISIKINSLRDEELWPQTWELIQGMSRMWGAMLECHHRQCEAVRKARGLDAAFSQTKPSDLRLEATLGLERELLGWAMRLSNWVSAQKGYVGAFNSWLMKCLPDTSPEETVDGAAPFSPGRMGAPPLFVISNQWFLSTMTLSEKEATDSIRALAGGVLLLWERDMLEMQQRAMANKTLEGKVKKMEIEDRKIRREIRTLEKKMPADPQAVYQSDMGSSISESLLRVFDSLERMAAGFTGAYGHLLRRAEEDGVTTR